MKRAAALCVLMLTTFPAAAGTAVGRSANVLQNIDFDPPLGAALPLDAVFRDESGQTVRLGDFFHGKPVVVAPVYYECPMLCTLTLNGVLKSARAIRPTAGADYEIVAVSINPHETADMAKKKRETYLTGYNRRRVFGDTDGGWHFLTGDEASIRRLTEALRFRYVFDPKSGQYAHASGVVVATPDGRIARPLFGPEFDARDMNLALAESSVGRISSPVTKVLLYCYAFDGSTGRYSLRIMNVVKASGAATAALLASGIGLLLWKERRSPEIGGRS